MSLVPCVACSQKISRMAIICPKCGSPADGSNPSPALAPPAKIKKPKLWLWIPLGLIGAFLAFAFLRTPSPEDHERYVDRAAINLCHDQLKALPVGAAEAGIVRGACELLERKFETAHGMKP